jgi:GDP-L-fucose synthase
LIAQGYTNLVCTSYPPYDLTNQKTVSDFFEREKPEYVFLAAAKVGGILSNNTFRAQFLYENLMIQNNIIHQSYLHDVKKLLFLGSSCIYPKNCLQPINEEYLLTGELEYTNEPYAIAKISGLKMCESYNIQYGTNFISVMPTNLYGPNDNYNLETSHVLPAMIRKMHLGKCLENNDWASLRKDLKRNPIKGVDYQSDKKEIILILEKHGISLDTLNPKRVTISFWGTGAPYREFLHVDDVADACTYLMGNVAFKDLKALSTLSSFEVKNTHINIGTGKDLTIKDLANIIKSVIGFTGQLLWDDSKPNGTFRKLLDVSKINRLGWKAKISMEVGISLVYNNYLK